MPLENEEPEPDEETTEAVKLYEEILNDAVAREEDYWKTRGDDDGFEDDNHFWERENSVDDDW